MLKHSVSHFLPNSRDIACSVAELKTALSPERSNENIKYFISSSGNRSHNLLRSQSCACGAVSRLTSALYILIKTYTKTTFKKTLFHLARHKFLPHCNANKLLLLVLLCHLNKPTQL